MDALKLKVVRVYVGTLMTSLEMAGVSLTLLNTPAQWVELLGKPIPCVRVYRILITLFLFPLSLSLSDLPTSAPGWPNPYSSHEVSVDPTLRGNIMAAASEQNQPPSGKATTNIGTQ